MESKQGLSVAAIVVTYNRKELLQECITALLNQTYENLDIFVIDNASSDGTKEYIRNHISSSRIHYYNTKENIGGAGGFNKGIQLVSKREYDYLWLMDDDTIPECNSLEQLMNAAKQLKYNFGFLSGYAQFVDGTPCKMNIPDLKQPNWIYDRNFISDGLVEIERATFVSFLLPREIVLKVGLPIKEFFIWADDTEYSKRISKDFPCYFVNNSVVTHKVKSNTGASDDDFINCDINRLGRYRYRYRNRFYVIKREGPRAIWDYLEEVIAMNFKLFGASNHRLKRIAVLWSGFIEGLFFNPPIEYIVNKDHTDS